MTSSFHSPSRRTLPLVVVLLATIAAPAEAQSTGYLGVDVQDITKERMADLKLKEERGVEVLMVDQDAPAGKAGLKEHDVILEFNGAKVESVEQLRRMIHETPPGSTVRMIVSRNGQVQTVAMPLAARNDGFRTPQSGKAATVVVQPAPPPAVPEPPRTATLKVSAQPGGVQVYLDNKPKGTTSEQEGELVLENLPAGIYKVRLSLPGYKDWSEERTVAAGQTLNLEAKLTPAGPKPLSADEVEEALRNGISNKRVMGFVHQFGVDFALTEELEQRLRAVGADAELLLAIAKGRK